MKLSAIVSEPQLDTLSGCRCNYTQLSQINFRNETLFRPFAMVQSKMNRKDFLVFGFTFLKSLPICNWKTSGCDIARLEGLI
jgi:hypothetical protein